MSLTPFAVAIANNKEALVAASLASLVVAVKQR